MLDVFMTVCHTICRNKFWLARWLQSFIIPTAKKFQSGKCKDIRMISLISHASKVMLRILLNCLKPYTECTLSEEQAGIKAGRNATEQITNLKIILEKHIQLKLQLYKIIQISGKLLTKFGMMDYGKL